MRLSPTGVRNITVVRGTATAAAGLLTISFLIFYYLKRRRHNNKDTTSPTEPIMSPTPTTEDVSTPNNANEEELFYFGESIATTRIPAGTFNLFKRTTNEAQQSRRQYFEYWASAAPGSRWRYGDSKKPLTDSATIRMEETLKCRIEEEDNQAHKAVPHAEMLRACGVSIDFLLAFTFELDLWDWPTWKVVLEVVKPATESRRCRFAHLPEIAPFTGNATIFISHGWGMSSPHGPNMSRESSGGRRQVAAGGTS